jgi:uncharacterized SAM-binding protein YcdF (DUF218 family)
MADRELELPSEEQRQRDRELIEALEQRRSVGERYASAGEVPEADHREPSMRTNPPVGAVGDPTPVRLAATPRRRVGPRVVLVLAVLAAIGVVYLGFSFWQVWSTGRTDEARPVDAIVVMGAAQYDGRPSPQLAARLDHVVELWQQDLAPKVIVTGGKRSGDRFTEAEASAAYLTDRGVPPAAIVMEGEGSTTYESLRNVADMVGDAVSTVLVVTDPYHALRSELIADSVGFDAFVSPTPTTVVRGAKQFRREVAEAAGVAVGRIIGFGRLSGLTG